MPTIYLQKSPTNHPQFQILLSETLTVGILNQRKALNLRSCQVLILYVFMSALVQTLMRLIIRYNS